MRYRSFLFAIVPLAVAVAPAMADTFITANFNKLDYGSPPYGGYYPVTVTINGGSATNEFAGRFDWTRAGSPGPNNNFDTSATSGIALGGDFKTFCIDLVQDVNFGQTGIVFQVTSLTSAPIGSTNTPMTSTQAGQVRALYGLEYNAVTDTDTAAAFQVALWEIAKDGALPSDLANPATAFSGGNFTMSAPSTILTLAEGYLTAVYNSDTSDQVPVDAFVSLSFQDQVWLLPSAASTVPLPGAAAAAVPILMLGGATLKSKRRRRQAEESAL